MSTIHDVAKKAGVSVSSVSLAYHKPHQLSEKTRNKILSVAKELGYNPNPNKIPKMLNTIVIALPYKGGIKQTQIPMISELTEKFLHKEYRTTLINYLSISDLNQKIKSLEYDKYVKGLIIVYNEQEELILKKYNIPIIIVSPHTFYAKCINIGCNYLENIVHEIKKNNEKGFMTVGVFVEKQYMQLDYLQKAKEYIISQYESMTKKTYPQELMCFLEGNNSDFDRVKKFLEQYKPDFLILVGAYSLNIIQTISESQILKGILIIEENTVYALKPENNIVVLERPLSKLAEAITVNIFELINNKQNIMQDRILIQ